MGDYIYAISHAGVTVTHLDTLEEVDTLQLVQVEPYNSKLQLPRQPKKKRISLKAEPLVGYSCSKALMRPLGPKKILQDNRSHD